MSRAPHPTLTTDVKSLPPTEVKSPPPPSPFHRSAPPLSCAAAGKKLGGWTWGAEGAGSGGRPGKGWSQVPESVKCWNQGRWRQGGCRILQRSFFLLSAETRWGGGAEVRGCHSCRRGPQKWPGGPDSGLVFDTCALGVKKKLLLIRLICKSYTFFSEHLPLICMYCNDYQLSILHFSLTKWHHI